MIFVTKLIDLLDKASRRKIWILLLGMIFSSLLEGLGLSGIPLYINTVFGDGNAGSLTPYISNFRSHAGSSFVLLFSLTILAFYLLKNLYYYLLNYQIHWFISKYKTYLETSLLNHFITEPYLKQISNNSSFYLRTIRDADIYINKVLLPSINSILDSLITMAIVLVLMFQLPFTLIVLLVMVVAFSFLLIGLLRKKMKFLGGKEITLRTEVLKVLTETFMLNKEIHVYQNYSFFSERFRKTATNVNRTVFQHGRLNIAIKPLMEIISIVMLVVIVMYFTIRPDPNIMGFLALLAVALVKMLPSLQALTTSINSIQYNSPVLDNIHGILKYNQTPVKEISVPGMEKKEFTVVTFDDVAFRYSENSKPAVDELIVNINKNEVIGIIGVSGAGKSTFIDLVLGLIHPTSGSIKVDGVRLDENEHNWRNNIGYVPQNLNLLDDTILNNILFGRPLDQEKMDYALRFSGVNNFLTAMEKELETEVGERGIKVSGGQKQRIGIARALYNKPGLLIFDEATSSLDLESEELITQTIQTLKNKMTVIIISHRYTPLRYCDAIYEFKEGRLVKSVSYNQLMANK